MKITRFYEKLSAHISDNPLTGWWLLFMFVASSYVMIYQTGYHLGRFIATL